MSDERYPSPEEQQREADEYENKMRKLIDDQKDAVDRLLERIERAIQAVNNLPKSRSENAFVASLQLYVFGLIKLLVHCMFWPSVFALMVAAVIPISMVAVADRIVHVIVCGPIRFSSFCQNVDPPAWVQRWKNVWPPFGPSDPNGADDSCVFAAIFFGFLGWVATIGYVYKHVLMD